MGSSGTLRWSQQSEGSSLGLGSSLQQEGVGGPGPSGQLMRGVWSSENNFRLRILNRKVESTGVGGCSRNR